MFTDGVLEIEIPRPATLDVGFDAGSETPDNKVPFDAVTLKVMETTSYLTVLSQEGDGRRQKLRLTDLAPGTYEVHVNTRSKLDGKEWQPAAAHAGFFLDTKEVVLGAAETRHVDFHYVPFDPNSFRGNRTAKIQIANPDGSSAAGRKVAVYYLDDHYRYVEVFSGKTPKSGEIEIKGLTDRQPTTVFLGKMFPGAYEVKLDGHWLGDFSFTKGAASESFSFYLPPRFGDVAPNIDLVDVLTGVRSKLHDFRGKVVCLELWSTGCGPCQPAMHKLNQLATEKDDAWRGRVLVAGLSIDERREDASRHVTQRGWDQVSHYWNGAEGATGWQSPAMHAFVAHGVPEVIIINRDGRIAWRGHPGDESHPMDIAAHVEEAAPQVTSN